MKYILAILALVGLAGMILMAWNNPACNIALSVPYLKLTIYTNYFVYASMLIICGFIAGMMFCGAFLLAQKEKIAPYKRQLEKMSVQNDSDTSRVAVLEAKVKTLEAALQKALDNK